MYSLRLLLTSFVAAGVAGAAAFAAPVLTVRFVDASPQIVQLKTDKAVAYDGDGAPLFRGDTAWLFKTAANPNHHVVAWSVQDGRIRITAEDKPGIWLYCADVQAMSIACSTSMRISDEGVLTIGPDSRRSADFPGATNPSSARIPDCPGDPRCP